MTLGMKLQTKQKYLPESWRESLLVYICNRRPQEAEAEGSRVQDQSSLQKKTGGWRN